MIKGTGKLSNLVRPVLVFHTAGQVIASNLFNGIRQLPQRLQRFPSHEPGCACSQEKHEGQAGNSP